MNPTTSTTSGPFSDSMRDLGSLVEFDGRMIPERERDQILENERLFRRAREAAEQPWAERVKQEQLRMRFPDRIWEACPKEWREITAELKVLVENKAETLLHPYYPLAGKLMHDEEEAKVFFGDPTPVRLLRIPSTPDEKPRYILARSEVPPAPGDRLSLRPVTWLVLRNDNTDRRADFTMTVMWAVPRISQDLYWYVGPGAFALGEIYDVLEESVMAFKPRG